MALLEQLRMKLNNKEYMKTRGSIYRCGPLVFKDNKMSGIEPLKIFVKFIPANTSEEEVKQFFSVCGKVLDVGLSSKNYEDKVHYMYAFITYKTQDAADLAVFKLNNQIMKPEYPRRLSVVHSLFKEARKGQSKDQEKKSAAFKGKDYEQLKKKCRDNAEKIDQLYNNPKETKEIADLRAKKYKLQAKQCELMKINNTLKEEISVLRLNLRQAKRRK